ncbi:hypothetical protein SAMN05216486_10738 [bacterium JGI 053]|nr:hypothetical protein SAMN05216486_10738 [bacterium JGI 053]
MTLSRYPATPPSEVEWEELLVRYELTPRALHATLDDVALEGDARDRVGDLLRALVANELQVTELFAAMRDGLPVQVDPRIEVMSAEPRAAYERFAALRGRNFAAVQRRGLEVWGWSAEAPGQGTVTAHQLILASTALDAETLAGVREALREAAV